MPTKNCPERSRDVNVRKLWPCVYIETDEGSWYKKLEVRNASLKSYGNGV